MDATGDATKATPRLGRYAIDAERSTITFRSRHLFGLLPVRGTFPVLGGTVDVAEPLATSAVRVEVDAAGMDTGNPQRDADVRSAKYLDAAAHPVIAFVSTDVTPEAITGTLTVRGTERPVTLTVRDSAVTADSFTVRATTRIDRFAFGVTAGRGMAGRHLDLTLEVACVAA